MRPGSIIPAFACLAAAVALLAGCGSGDSTTASSSDGRAIASMPAPAKSEFPAADGRSLQEVLESEGAEPAELVLAPASTVFETGENRFSFGVFDKDGSQAGNVPVALYFAKVPKVNQEAEKPNAKGAAARASIKALEMKATGPFPARIETLETQPAFRAETTSDDPNAAKAIYSTEVDFPSAGEWRIAALLREGGQLKSTLLSSAIVGRSPRIPKVGEKAPLIHTPTPDDVGGDLSKITTRIPPDTQNQVDYADAYGKEPIVLLFATPQFCQSRVCGPVVDVAEQVKQVFGDKAAFIHMEIYEDNDPSAPTRPQVKAFHLPTEPWLFVIDKEGVITDRIEGAFGVEELTKAVERVTSE